LTGRRDFTEDALLSEAFVNIGGAVSAISQLHYKITSAIPPYAFPKRKPTRKNSPSVELYGLQGLPLTYFYKVHVSDEAFMDFKIQYQVFGEPKSQHSQHTLKFVIRISHAKDSVSKIRS
jgi:hypothetical protein